MTKTKTIIYSLILGLIFLMTSLFLQNKLNKLNDVFPGRVVEDADTGELIGCTPLIYEKIGFPISYNNIIYDYCSFECSQFNEMPNNFYKIVVLFLNFLLFSLASFLLLILVKKIKRKREING